MCGIIGYLGNQNAKDILIKGLYQLEYRGYDSSGIALLQEETWQIKKCKGRVHDLETLIKDEKNGHVGMAHTRWATHGEPSIVNSHPHESANTIIIHNGIIENYYELRKMLIKKGYRFISDTDTEVVAHLLDYRYQGDPLACLQTVLNEIHGSYAFVIAFKDKQDTLYGVKKDSPLIVASSSIGNFLASDATAIVEYTNQYYDLNQGEIAIVKKDSIAFLNADFTPIKKEPVLYQASFQDVNKGEYDHHMLKEIFTQPKVLHRFLEDSIKDEDIEFEEIPDSLFTNITKIHLVGCGSAANAALVGKRVIESVAKVEVEVHLASEFRYYDPLLKKGHLVIVISQSGETADTLSALRMVKEKEIPVIAICNVLTSSIAKEADYLIFTNGGVEIAVASTKAYLLQLATLYLLALKLGKLTNVISQTDYVEKIQQMQSLPLIIEETLQIASNCKFLATLYYHCPNMFFLGRYLDYPLSVEGSLKMKEISYIHTEAFASGELKHGTISLIEKGTPVIGLVTHKDLLHKSISNLKEVKSRGASVIVLSQFEEEQFDEVHNHFIKLPMVDSLFAPFSAIVVLQLLAYYFALLNGNDVDKPRNLAKSVTVE